MPPSPMTVDSGGPGGPAVERSQPVRPGGAEWGNQGVNDLRTAVSVGRDGWAPGGMPPGRSGQSQPLVRTASGHAARSDSLRVGTGCRADLWLPFAWCAMASAPVVHGGSGIASVSARSRGPRCEPEGDCHWRIIHTTRCLSAWPCPLAAVWMPSTMLAAGTVPSTVTAAADGRGGVHDASYSGLGKSVGP